MADENETKIRDAAGQFGTETPVGSPVDVPAMSAGGRLLDAMKEAVEIAKGAIPAARIWHNGWAYVPQPRSIDEAIIAAAVIFDEEVWHLPSPARHHHVLWAIDQVHPGRAIEAHVQGFMTNTGRFVEREEAARIASMAGQVGKLSAPPHLFSEDLW